MAMTSYRFNFIINRCFSRKKHNNGATLDDHHRNIAKFLQVPMRTMRRYLSGKETIPRTVEIIMEIFLAWPEVTAAEIQFRIDAQREPED